MNDVSMKRFVKERNKVFRDVLHHDNFKSLLKYCKKYDINIPKNQDVLKAGVYKAIIASDSFSEEEIDIALMKCMKLGFNPFIKGA